MRQGDARVSAAPRVPRTPCGSPGPGLRARAVPPPRRAPSARRGQVRRAVPCDVARPRSRSRDTRCGSGPVCNSGGATGAGSGPSPSVVAAIEGVPAARDPRPRRSGVHHRAAQRRRRRRRDHRALRGARLRAAQRAQRAPRPRAARRHLDRGRDRGGAPRRPRGHRRRRGRRARARRRVHGCADDRPRPPVPQRRRPSPAPHQGGRGGPREALPGRARRRRDPPRARPDAHARREGPLRRISLDGERSKERMVQANLRLVVPRPASSPAATSTSSS
jgi:hypothetical protein